MLAHASYIQFAREDLEKVIRHLETSHNESGDFIVGEIINNLKDCLETLQSNTYELFPSREITLADILMGRKSIQAYDKNDNKINFAILEDDYVAVVE
ncbi:hypothetical protein [Caulobacter phage Cr30]|uniref:hypothetical protein n=1 Tax=Caulobacter phage Cr30 TaxID=1357714 RepID=UPI0004A9B7F3|nr:hypothetical protein OZ74_gp244 [Caulobacter phage Cr30]AGS81099.1 hypothetical protein [Caulobacter phage Cr30]